MYYVITHMGNRRETSSLTEAILFAKQLSKLAQNKGIRFDVREVGTDKVVFTIIR